MFKVNYIQDISLSEIKNMQENYSFLRSAHIGNFNKQTLILAKEGMHILLHEHLRGNAKIYEPSYIKYKNSKIKISDNEDEVLQLYDNTLNIKEKYDCYKPSQIHFKALKAIYNDNIELASEFLLYQKEFILKAIKVLSENFPEQLYRYEDKEGNSYDYISKMENGDLKYTCYDKIKIISKKDVLSEILNMLESTKECIYDKKIKNPEGIVMNSRMYILLFSISEIYINRIGKQRYDKEKVDIYHFAGTQMINYLCQNEEMSKENSLFFKEAYKKLYNEFPEELPKEVNFNLLSTAEMQYIGCLKTDNYKILDEILKIYKDIENLKKVKKSKISLNIKDCVKTLNSLTFNELEDLINTLILPNSTLKKIQNFLENYEDNKKSIIGEIVNFYRKSGVLVKENEKTTDEINLNISEKEKKLKLLILQNLDLFYKEITQYDLLIKKEEIYVSKEVYDMKFYQLEDFVRLVKGIKKEKEDKIQRELIQRKLEDIKFAPIQIKVLTIGNQQINYSNEIVSMLNKDNFRVKLDERDKKIGYKIRDAQVEKIPYMLILGEKEQAEGTVALRSLKEGNLGTMTYNEVVNKLKREL